MLEFSLMTKTKIILASGSIGRKQLLEKLGVPFQVIPSSIDEEKITDTNPFVMLQKRSRAKAQNVLSSLSKRYTLNVYPERSRRAKRYLIIAADSMAILGNKAYGKPKNKKHAKDFLSDLMGKTHIFATATYIILLKHPSVNNPSQPPLNLRGGVNIPPLRLRGGEGELETYRWENLTKTKVTLRKLSSSELSFYTSHYDLTRFAAGYALNETPWDLVTKIEGSYTNVIGLPFEILLPILSSFKII